MILNCGKLCDFIKNCTQFSKCIILSTIHEQNHHNPQSFVNFPQFLYIYANKHPVVLSQRVFFYDSFNACTILLTLSM